MLAFLVLAALAVVSSVTGLPLDSQTDNGRIVGGKSTTIDQYPYQVILEQTDSSISCGGSIIAKNVVLTAAHCVSRLYGPPYGRQIRAGSSYPSKGGSVHKIAKVIVHEGYSQYALENDAALIFVEEPFEFDSSRQPINLRSSTEEIPNGALATITGFGRLRSGGALPKQLQVAQLPIVSKELCNEAYNVKVRGIGPGQICAGILGVGGKDTCQGDSGGPLVVDGQLAGIVSYGYGCAEPDYPGVYTEVAYFYDWIVENSGLSA